MAPHKDSLDALLSSVRDLEWTNGQHQELLRERLVREHAGLRCRSLPYLRLAVLVGAFAAALVCGAVFAAVGGLDQVRTWFIYRTHAEHRPDGAMKARFDVERVIVGDGQHEKDPLAFPEGTATANTLRIESNGENGPTESVRGLLGAGAQGVVTHLWLEEGVPRATIITSPHSPSRAQLEIETPPLDADGRQPE